MLGEETKIEKCHPTGQKNDNTQVWEVDMMVCFVYCLFFTSVGYLLYYWGWWCFFAHICLSKAVSMDEYVFPIVYNRLQSFQSLWLVGLDLVIVSCKSVRERASPFLFDSCTILSEV